MGCRHSSPRKSCASSCPSRRSRHCPMPTPECASQQKPHPRVRGSGTDRERGPKIMSERFPPAKSPGRRSIAATGSFATFAAIRRFFRSQFIGGMANTSMQRLLSNASCHHVSTAAFPASQPFDELANWGISPYSKTCKFPFGDYAFVMARKTLY